MSETALTAGIALAAMFGLAPAILWANDRLSRARWNRSNPPEKIAADRRAFEARLLQPDWAFDERHLQLRVLLGLRELYADRARDTGVFAESVEAMVGTIRRANPPGSR